MTRVILTMLALLTATSMATAGGGLELTSYTLSGGGGTTSGGNLTLTATIGQHDTGRTSGGGLTLEGGFWGGVEPGDACAADIDGDGAVGVTDLLAVILAWGFCPGCPADINADNLVDVQDLLDVILTWGECP